MNITLILAARPDEPLIKKDPFMPLSLAILAATAPEHNYTLIDMLWDADKLDYDTSDEIIGISLRKTAEEAAYKMADEFLKRGKTVILGGAQTSSVPHRAKEHATSVVVGEAEELWGPLLKDYQEGKLKDFYVCSPAKFDAKGKTFYQQENLPDLANLPTPNRKLFKRKYTFDMTFASRGCPINCDFCVVSDIYGKKIRLKPIDDVIKDIKHFKGFYYLLDDTVFGRVKDYDYYIELYDRIAKETKRKYWTGQANLDAAATEKGREVIRKAAKSGLVYAAIGVESINKKTLKDSGAFSKMGIKNADEYIEIMKKHIRFIQDQGIIVSGWFALGYETDTVQTYYDTLKFCEETNILPVFSPVTALDNSRLMKRIEAEGRIQDDNINVSNIVHPKLTNKEIVHALSDTAIKGYTRKQNWKRIKFYAKIFFKSESNWNRALYKTIFAIITQMKMKGIVDSEMKHMNEKFG